MFFCMLCHRCCIVGTLTELLKSETTKTLLFTPLLEEARNVLYHHITYYLPQVESCWV